MVIMKAYTEKQRMAKNEDQLTEYVKKKLRQMQLRRLFIAIGKSVWWKRKWIEKVILNF